MGFLSDAFGSIDIQDFFQQMYYAGWYDFVFPFLMVYAIVFTILEKVELFQDAKKKPIRVVIAIIFGFFAVAFPITGNVAECGITTSPGGGVGDTTCATLGGLMMSLFPGVTAFSFGILGLYIVASMLGLDLMKFLDAEGGSKWIKWVLGGLGAFIVIYYYARGFGWNGFDDGSMAWLWGSGGLLRDPALYFIAILGFLLYWIGSSDLTDEEKKAKKAKADEKKAKPATETTNP